MTALTLSFGLLYLQGLLFKKRLLFHNYFCCRRCIRGIYLFHVIKNHFHTSLFLGSLLICQNFGEYFPLIPLILICDFVDKWVVHFLKEDVGFLLNILEHRLYLIVIHDLQPHLVRTRAPWILLGHLWRQFKKLGIGRLWLDGQLSELRRVILLNLSVMFTESHWFHLV